MQVTRIEFHRSDGSILYIEGESVRNFEDNNRMCLVRACKDEQLVFLPVEWKKRENKVPVWFPEKQLQEYREAMKQREYKVLPPI